LLCDPQIGVDALFGTGNDVLFELGQNRPAIGTRESKGGPQVTPGQIVQLVELFQFVAKRLFKVQALFQQIGCFVRGFDFLGKLYLAIIVVIARATTPSASATQALQVVAPDFVFEQLKQCAFMARLEDVQIFVLGLPGKIKGDDFLLNVARILAQL